MVVSEPTPSKHGLLVEAAQENILALRPHELTVDGKSDEGVEKQLQKSWKETNFVNFYLPHSYG
jgi:hypothetical protein